MNDRAYNLAIETSSRAGSVTLGRGAEALATVELGEQRRHAIALMPAIDRLFADHGATPADLGALFVSHGPGSFTGLRVGITTAKTLADVTAAALVPVPTLDVVAANVSPTSDRNSGGRLAVLLNAKGGRWFTGLYAADLDALTGWRRTQDPTLMTADELIALAGDGEEPLAVVGDHPGDTDWPDTVRWADAALARPRSPIVHRIGAALLEAGHTVDPLALTPLYVRLPDAEEVWQQRHGSATAK